MAKSFGNLKIGTHVFDVETLELRDANGQALPLRAQSAHVLKELVLANGGLVTKAELMDRIWSDRFVTDDSLVKCVSDIRKALGTDAGRLETLSKRGYRLSVDETTEIERSSGSRSTVASARRFGFLSAGALVAAAFVVAWVTMFHTNAPLREGPVTLAVLPFRNPDGDASQRYLSDGVAEDLITALSQLSDMRLISQGASFSYSPDDADIREIAGLLSADFVLEGSLRRRGDDLRLTTALVDGTTGENVWAQQYDGDRADLLAFQTNVLEELVRTLSVRLSKAERARLGIRGTSDVEAHDAYLKGRELENLYTRRTNYEAEKALRRAISRDPGYALAHAHLALTLSFRVENNWTDAREEAVKSAFVAAERAVALDPELPFAHFALGRLYSRSFSHDLPNSTEKAFAAFETAIALDPNYTDGYVFLANLHIFNGEAEKALPLIEDALARHPVPPFWYRFAAGMARYFTGDFEEALPYLIAARDQNPTAPFPHRYLIATYGALGLADDAEWAAMEYEALGRIATVDAMVTSGSVSDPVYREKFADGLRAAGLPDF